MPYEVTPVHFDLEMYDRIGEMGLETLSYKCERIPSFRESGDVFRVNHVLSDFSVFMSSAGMMFRAYDGEHEFADRINDYSALDDWLMNHYDSKKSYSVEAVNIPEFLDRKIAGRISSDGNPKNLHGVVVDGFDVCSPIDFTRNNGNLEYWNGEISSDKIDSDIIGRLKKTYKGVEGCFYFMFVKDDTKKRAKESICTFAMQEDDPPCHHPEDP